MDTFWWVISDVAALSVGYTARYFLRRCRHEWMLEERIVWPGGTAITFVLRCEHCGHLKSKTVL